MNDRFLEDLKNRIDIVEIVRKYAELKKSGKNYMCRSPFRNERTPSFCVSMEKQFWYDFGTSEGGDVISFLEKIENFSFPEAVEYLADMAGMENPASRRGFPLASAVGGLSLSCAPRSQRGIAKLFAVEREGTRAARSGCHLERIGVPKLECVGSSVAV